MICTNYSRLNVVMQSPIHPVHFTLVLSSSTHGLSPSLQSLRQQPYGFDANQQKWRLYPFVIFRDKFDVTLFFQGGAFHVYSIDGSGIAETKIKLAAPRTASSLSFSPDGTKLAVVNEKTILIYNVVDGFEVSELLFLLADRISLKFKFF